MQALPPRRHILRRAHHLASRVLLLKDTAGHHGVGGGDNSVLGDRVGAVKAEGDFELAMSHRRIRFEICILPFGAPVTWTKFGDYHPPNDPLLKQPPQSPIIPAVRKTNFPADELVALVASEFLSFSLIESNLGLPLFLIQLFAPD
jgi:hypothetical protein